MKFSCNNILSAVTVESFGEASPLSFHASSVVANITWLSVQESLSVTRRSQRAVHIHPYCVP